LGYRPSSSEKEFLSAPIHSPPLWSPIRSFSDQQDEELDEATKGLEPQDGSMVEEKIEDIGEIKPEEPQVPEVDLKPLPKGLKYEFLGPDKTYPVIVSDKLSPEENEKLLILLKKHRKVI
jgi:hypothetical protein